MRLAPLVAVLVLMPACRFASTEERVRQALRKGGIVELPAGDIEVSSELVIPDGTRGLVVRGAASGTVLRAANNFRGRALLVANSAQNVRFEGFILDGNRNRLEKPSGLPPSNVPFSRFTSNNGILIEDAASAVIERIRFRRIAGFAVLVVRSHDLRIEGLTVQDSGSLDAAGHDNTTGGILLEEGTQRFEVARCRLIRVRGNGIWTHSIAGSVRAREGRIAANEFEEMGRDAIQVGHAAAIRVESNRGRRLGYPLPIVDPQIGSVAIDTAGNVDQSVYRDNHFEEVNGQCIDLDGFHDGEVLRNVCLNRVPREAYPNGQFAIVFNNTDPHVEPSGITLAENEIDGSVRGGIFLIGAGNTVVNNRLLNLNMARCVPSTAGCIYWPGEPGLLTSGIYLASHGTRPAATRDNVIRNNTVAGFGMARQCVTAAPGVSLKNNRADSNRCEDGR